MPELRRAAGTWMAGLTLTGSAPRSTIAEVLARPTARLAFFDLAPDSPESVSA